MATFPGGTLVAAGYYVDRKSFTFVNVERDGTALPGGAEQRYLRVPAVAVMAAAPALGGLFVVALPLIGVGMTVYGLAKRLGAGAKAGATEIAATLATPAAAPGEAHLTGHPAKEEPAGGALPDAGTAKADDPTAALEKSIEAQRGTVY